MQKTVEEFYSIDEDALAEKSCQSEYWQNCLDFYLQNKMKPINALSKKQADWLQKIEDQLEEDYVKNG